jgi:hypothetical protein
MHGKRHSRPDPRLRPADIRVVSRWINETANHRGLEITVYRLTDHKVKVRPARCGSHRWSSSQLENTWTLRYDQFFHAYRELR